MVDTVKIACKLPNGLVVTHKGKSVTLNGANDPSAVAGFGITPGVDAGWFGDWTKGPGKSLPFVANGSVFAMKSDDTGEAQERKDIYTGMDPLDPDKPMSGIEPTDETKKVLNGDAGDV